MTVQAAEPRSLLRRLYDWCVAAAGKPHAVAILIAVAFAESSFFPIPPDVMLVPMSLARPDRAFRFAAWCTLASVAGGILGYAIGAVLYDSVGRLADPSLRLRRQGRSLPRRLRPVGRLDHPAQGAHAHPLQDRHHYVGLCRLQLRPVRGLVGDHPRRPVLHPCFPAPSLRRCGAAYHREEAGFMDLVIPGCPHHRHRGGAVSDLTVTSFSPPARPNGTAGANAAGRRRRSPARTSH